ncbi:MAG: 6,7-dimethyl-8-ribityllumazine synthase [Acidimicrobiales bacterium]
MPEATHRLPQELEGGSRPDELIGSTDGSSLRIAVLCARFNSEITLRLLDGAYEALSRLKVPEEGRLVAWVPGAYELPLAARVLGGGGCFDAVVCLGAVVRGETSHYDFVAGECARGLQQAQVDTGVPTIFGVLTTENLDQALERSGGKLGNKGDEAVVTAVEMANLLAQLRTGWIA